MNQNYTFRQNVKIRRYSYKKINISPSYKKRKRRPRKSQKKARRSAPEFRPIPDTFGSKPQCWERLGAVPAKTSKTLSSKARWPGICIQLWAHQEVLIKEVFHDPATRKPEMAPETTQNGPQNNLKRGPTSPVFHLSSSPCIHLSTSLPLQLPATPPVHPSTSKPPHTCTASILPSSHESINSCTNPSMHPSIHQSIQHSFLH